MTEETKAFKDMLFHKHKAEMLVANDGLPRWCVTLRRDGFNGIGEEMGVVEISKHERFLDGTEPDFDAIMQKTYEEFTSGQDSSVVMRYSNSLDKAQGYAQGALDALRASLAVAGNGT